MKESKKVKELIKLFEEIMERLPPDRKAAMLRGIIDACNEYEDDQPESS